MYSFRPLATTRGTKHRLLPFIRDFYAVKGAVICRVVYVDIC